MKKEYYLEKNIIIILAGIEVVVASIGIAWLEDFRYKFSYDDLRLIVQLFTGVAPFVAAFSAYWMWSKNREKELKQLDYRNDYYKKILDLRISTYVMLYEFLYLIDVETGMNLVNENKNIKEYKFRYMFSNIEKLSKAVDIITKLEKNYIFLNDDTANSVRDLTLLVLSVEYYIIGRNKNAVIEYLKSKEDTEGYTEAEFNKIVKEFDENEKQIENEHKKNVDFKLIALGVFFNDILEKKNKSLYEKIMRDMQNLHEIEGFLNAKKKK